MIITCPNCQTRYQVAQNAIGSAGRKVQCANCQQSWQAVPEPDEPPPPKPRLVETKKTNDDMEKPPLDPGAEAEMDAEFEAAAGQTTGRKSARDADSLMRSMEELADSELDTGLSEQRHRAMRARQQRFAKKLPMGRVRKNARILAFTLLGIIVIGGFFGRTEIVRTFPDLAGVYQAVGLSVNVIGLEFDNVETLRAQQDGQDVTIISGRVRNVTGEQVQIPAIIVSICGPDNEVLYSWSVAPPVQFLGPGESVEFETQLNSAPGDAETIELVFEDGRAR